MSPTTEVADRPAWYETAVFYELPVKSFFDANGDGVGDFVGLTRRLDYLQELGITAVWLLPFFPSPLRDDGYDVADYRDVHPALGTIADFRAFVDAARRRGIKVAAEMVINHTSDQHPWFQAAREAPAGSPLREFYVWSDSDQRFRDAHVQYGDVKRSNWTWDPVARAYYWHRFFPHQPDLNYDNPQVRSEVMKVLRFWLDQGVDGLCLNGAAYLVEADGTACEHLTATHAVLKAMRLKLAADYPGRMIQAGVSAWPADAASYFGTGDECHMAPNLALAQRLFLALRQEDRHAVTNLLRQTPAPPPGCQWVTLLRNHDELTLTLATDEERDYMFREYAADPRARLHVGIRRRLAPLVDNDRRRIELLFGLLFGLPGAPVIYYGDELGMGDNVLLGGRAGVRTPMPWGPDRNAGFSSADSAHLFAPPVADPVYGYQAANVEAQRRDPSSLFHAIRRLVGVRRASRTLAAGRLELLEPANRKVIAFVRRHGDESILVVANLSRTAQPVELDLAACGGRVPVEMFGRVAFPPIGDRPYTLALGPYGFYWFQLQTEADEVAARLAPVATERVEVLPTLTVRGEWQSLFHDAREELERAVLPGYLRSQRWFGGKAREVSAVRVADHGPLPVGTAFLVLLDVEFAGGRRDLYSVPLAVSAGTAAVHLLESHRASVLARLRGPNGEAVLHDAVADDAVCTALLNAVAAGHEFRTGAGRIRAEATAAFARLRGDPDDRLPVVHGPATSSNTLVFFGRRLLLKLFRRLEVGTNPDYEVGRFLTEESPFGRIPQVAGTLEYRRPDRGPVSLAVFQALVPNQGDGWQHAIGELGGYYERAAARMAGPDPVVPDPRPVPELIDAAPPPAALETIGSYLHAAATLGRRTAEMHVALANGRGNPAFAPEPLSATDLDALRGEIRKQAEGALMALQANLNRLPADVGESARTLLELGPAVVRDPLPAGVGVPAATRTRIHGDYHLGQVLWVDNDFVILDFEGEPTRTVEERREKFSPLRDVAGMLRSYHYAAYAGLFAFTNDRPDDFPRLETWADLWHQWAAAAFLRGYRQAAGRAHFVPKVPVEFAALLDGFMLCKAFYELAYELNNRPDWVRIPLRGILDLLKRPTER
jgi:maltose alpha-D-glucosyltransferase / alpha-amylase